VQVENASEVVKNHSLDRKRTLSLAEEDVIKCIEHVDGDDVLAMKRAAWDLAQQVPFAFHHACLGP
jgi:hypothetical protein